MELFGKASCPRPATTRNEDGGGSLQTLFARSTAETKTDARVARLLSSKSGELELQGQRCNDGALQTGYAVRNMSSDGMAAEPNVRT